MNAIAPIANSAARWDCYVRLGPDARLILRLKSLIVPAVTKTEFAACLARTALRTGAGKAWAPVTINPVINDLLSQGLLNADLECVPELLHQVAADAGMSEDAEVLAKAVRLTFPAQSSTTYYRSYIDATQHHAMQRLIRLEIYTNDEVEFRLNRKLFERTYGDHSTLMFLAGAFYDVPLKADWIATRHPAIQVPLLEAKLNSFIVTGLAGSEMPSMVALCRTAQGQEGFESLQTQLRRYDLLAGRLDDVRDAAKTVEDAAGDTRLSLEGAVAFLKAATTRRCCTTARP